MNRAYRTVWNAVTATWNVASELAKGRTKKSQTRGISAAAVMGALIVGAIGTAASTHASAAEWIGNTDSCVASTGTITAKPGNNAAEDAVAYSEGIAIGSKAVASSTCMSTSGIYSGYSAIAMGMHATSTNGGLALGYGAFSSGLDSLAFGPAAASTGKSSVALGAGANDGGRANVVSVGLGENSIQENPQGGTTPNAANAAKYRQIINMAAGTVDTDAVNVSQLKGVTTALGGGAAVNADGTIKAPTYTVQGQTKSDVGSALSAIDTATTGNTTSITNLTNNINNGTVGLVQQDATTKAITVAKATNGTTVDFTGTAGARQLKGVSKGTADTDAVNLAQLKAAGLNVDTSGNVSNAFVAYDDATKGKVTLAGGAAGTTITNVKAGALSTTSTDAVNGSQLNATNTNVTNLSNTVDNITNGNAGIKYFHVNSTAADSVASSVDSMAIGGGAVANGGRGAIAIGANASAQGGYANGGSFSIALGYGANADATAGNWGNNTAIGGNAKANTTNGVALGSQAIASGGNATALGYGAVASAGNSTALGIQSVADRTNTVSVGSSTNQRQIVNVANGTADTDAVNVSQLKGVTTALGGGAAVNSDGTIKAPTYTVQGQTKSDVGSALSAIDTATTGNTTSITNLTNNINNGTVGLVQQDAATKAITVAKATNGTTVDFTGTAGARQLKGVAAGKADTDAVNMSQLKAAGLNVDTSGNVSNAFVAYDDATKGKVTLAGGAAGTTITNVKAGALSASSTDAVNGSQLYATNQNVAQNTSDITTLNSKIININGSLADAVAYDSSAHDKVTLNGANGTTITNVKAGAVNATSTDAVNGSQLYSVSTSVADAIGGGSTVNADGTISAPSYTVDGTTVHNIGDAITNIDERTTINSTAISNINESLNNITNNGTGIKYFHANSVLADSQAIGTDAVAIGGNARAQADNSVALGANSVSDRANTVSVGAAGAERQITNVAAGTADTDAVNLGQLKAAGLINTDGTANAAATYDHNADGSINYNSITMGDNVAGGTTIHNVAAGTDSMDAVNVNQMNEAIANVTNIANNSSNPLFTANGSRETEAAVASGNHATAMGANAKASADNSVALGANSVADRANTVSVGAAGSERQIANVAAGTEATDAVNVEQLNAAVGDAIGNMPAGMTAKDYTDSRINSVQNSVNQVAKNSYAGIAAAMAMPNLTPSQPGKTVVAAGSGVYKSGAAAAVGVTHRSRNGKWLTNGALSVTSTGDTGARVQVGYEF
jgi:autotransporter adhesin